MIIGFFSINLLIATSRPFLDAYNHSDLLGKLIFLSLITLSVITWTFLIYKYKRTRIVKKLSKNFEKNFIKNQLTPLNFEVEPFIKNEKYNSYFKLYRVLKKNTIEILTKNHRYGGFGDSEEVTSYLSSSDVDFIQTHLMTKVAMETQRLEKNLFILSTIVSLAPFLGMLGTVWGILITFSGPPLHQASGGAQQLVLGGVSLALTTTVLGLVDAIPALIGYNFLKHTIQDFGTEMESFSNSLVASVELQYRKVEVSGD